MSASSISPASVWQERSRSALHVEHEAREPLSELLAHDARRDERNRLDRRRRVAQCVELPVHRRDLRALAEQRAADALELPRAAASVRSLRNPGIASSLSSVPPVCPRPRPDIIGTDDAHRRRERRQHERHLVANAASRVFIDARSRKSVEIECSAAAKHRVGERGGLLAIQSTEKHRHQKCRHLIVGYVSRQVRAEQRTPLARIDSSAIAFSFDQSNGEH